jgi:CRISPR-associated endonuclease/helicase Cas3
LECCEEKSDEYKTPLYYDSNKSGLIFIKTFVRSCVVSGDRLSSEYNNILLTDEEINKIIDKQISIDGSIDSSEDAYDNLRFREQKAIVDDIGRTTIVKAPAGFGKTMLGLLWSFRSNKKLIWVCPRNIIADSTYNSVISELSRYGSNKLSVELFLSGEVKESTHKCSGFDSDIIITNIDSFLKPSVDDAGMGNLFFINSCDVIFDEFHELITESALFSCFINLMKCRNLLTDSSTLLLSATPNKINFLWESLVHKTLVLPNEETHYKAIHDKPYKVNVSRDRLESIKDSRSLIIFNSIKNSQTQKNSYNCNLLVHSKFTDSDRKKVINQITSDYGKGSVDRLVNGNVIGTHVLQAGLDISFKHLYESVFSPDATIQRIGRIDRFGNLNDGISTINISGFLTKDNEVGTSEVSTRTKIYNNNLTNTWFEYCESELAGKEISLDELYVHYNRFYSMNDRGIKSYIKSSYTSSLNRLSEIYPIRFDVNKKRGEIKTAGGNKLRSSNSDIFVIARIYDTKDYTEVFNQQIYKNFRDDFHEGENMELELKKIMKYLRDINDTRYDYNELLNNKKLGIDGIRFAAKKSNTPYIRFDVVYHEEYGLINEDDLRNILR